MEMALLLLCVSLYFSLVSTSTFLDFRIDTVDPNELILECYDSDSGIIDGGAIIDFFFPGVSAPHRSSPTGPGNTGLRYAVTPTNEALLHCTASDGSGDMSDQVAIAGMYDCMYVSFSYSPNNYFPTHFNRSFCATRMHTVCRYN